MTEYCFVNPSLRRNGIFSAAEKIELIWTHPVFWPGGATNFFNELCRERLQAGFSLLVISPAILQNKVVFRIDTHRNGSEVQSFATSDFIGFISQYVSQIVRIRVNNFHGMFFFSRHGYFELSVYRQLTSAILALKRKCRCELVYYFHDFLSVCPFLFFVSDKQEFCDPDSNTEKCRECVKHPHPWTAAADPALDMAAWRKCSYEFLSECTQLIFFSLAGVNLMEKILPGVVTKRPERLTIRGQSIEQGSFQPVVPAQRKQMVVGVIGSIGVVKGAKQIIGLQQYIRNTHKKAKIVIVGKVEPEFVSAMEEVTITGAYRHEELPALIGKYGINVIFFSSICPETFSRVVSEIQMMDLPLALFPLGAPAERMRFYEKAMLIPGFSPESIYQSLWTLFLRFVAQPE